jgi:hypothetical protein
MHVVLPVQESVSVMTNRLLLRSSDTGCIKCHLTPSTRGNFNRHATTLHLLAKIIHATDVIDPELFWGLPTGTVPAHYRQMKLSTYFHLEPRSRMIPYLTALYTPSWIDTSAQK